MSDGDARTDDVADAEQRGIVLERNGAAFERFPENFLRDFLQDFEDCMQPVVDEADPEAAEDDLAAADRFVRRGARHGIAGMRGIARFRRRGGLQHFGAGRAFRIFQETVLLRR